MKFIFSILILLSSMAFAGEKSYTVCGVNKTKLATIVKKSDTDMSLTFHSVENSPTIDAKILATDILDAEQVEPVSNMLKEMGYASELSSGISYQVVRAELASNPDAPTFVVMIFAQKDGGTTIIIHVNGQFGVATTTDCEGAK